MNDKNKHFLIDVYDDYDFGEFKPNTTAFEVYQRLVNAKSRLIQQIGMIDLELRNFDKTLHKDLLDDK